MLWDYRQGISFDDIVVCCMQFHTAGEILYAEHLVQDATGHL
jgi:hypothetical protein